MFDKRTLQAYAFLAAIGLIGVVVALAMARRPEVSALVAGVVVALIVPVPLIWLFRKLGYPLGKVIHCPRCANELPAVRRPANFRQAMMGGYTCAKCGADLDARGRERAAP